MSTPSSPDPTPAHTSSPASAPVPAPSSSRTDQPDTSQGTMSRAWQSALLEARAQTSDHVLPSRQWFRQLPDINRWLLGSSATCFLLGLFCLIGVPLLGAASSATQAAYRPYTSEGKQETCLSNLQRVASAFAQYRSDYDDKFPIAEYSQGGRKTWTAQLASRGLEANSLICPAQGRSGSDGRIISSYGFNPVLYGQWPDKISGEGGAAKTLLLADRGELHDTILLPPFVGWPKQPSNNTNSGGNESNLDLRHGVAQVAVLYADGHAGSQSAGSWTSETGTWGGSLALQVSATRLEAQFPVLKQLAKSPARAFRNQKAKLRQGLDQLHLLQKQAIASSTKSEPTEKRLWKGAGFLRLLGDKTLEGELTRDLHTQSQTLLSQSQGEQTLYESELGFAISHPSTWKVETQQDGRYHTTYLRSSSPYIEALVERGERARPTNATTIDWSGMEDGLKRKYRKGYKRIRLDQGVLGGETVSFWECELKKPDGPRLRKMYYGHSTMWNSTILVCTAPVGEWNEWQSMFEQFRSSFQFKQ